MNQVLTWDGLSKIANITELVGFALGIATLVIATKAKKAAQEARMSVLHGSASDDFRRLSAQMGELIGLIRDNQTAAASIRSRDLLANAIVAQHRWQEFLVQHNLKEICSAAVEDLKVANRFISDGNLTNAKLAKNCQGIYEAFNQITGVLVRIGDSKK